MRHLPALLFVIALGVPLAAVCVFAQAVGSWFLTGPGSTPPDQLFGTALFILPAAFVGVVAGAALGRRGAVVLLVPLGVIVFLLWKAVVEKFRFDPLTWGDIAFLAAGTAPYAVGWGVGWTIRIRRAASFSSQVLTSGPNWTSPDVKHHP